MIVFPEGVNPSVLAHEIGHYLDARENGAVTRDEYLQVVAARGLYATEVAAWRQAEKIYPVNKEIERYALISYKFHRINVTLLVAAMVVVLVLGITKRAEKQHLAKITLTILAESIKTLNKGGKK